MGCFRKSRLTLCDKILNFVTLKWWNQSLTGHSAVFVKNLASKVNDMSAYFGEKLIIL